MVPRRCPVRAPGRLVPVGAGRGCGSLRYGAGAGRRPHPAPSTMCQLARTAGVTSRAEAAWGRAHRSRTAPCRSSSTAVATLAGRERGARTGRQCRSHVTARASWRRAAATGRELRTRAPPRPPIAPPTTMCQLAQTAGAICKPETERSNAASPRSSMTAVATSRPGATAMRRRPRVSLGHPSVPLDDRPLSIATRPPRRPAQRGVPTPAGAPPREQDGRRRPARRAGRDRRRDRHVPFALDPGATRPERP
jgi:hypothetical protein